MSTRQSKIYKTFDIEGCNLFYSVAADDFIAVINDTVEKGRAQGFGDFNVEISGYTNDDGTEITVSLNGSRPETKKEQQARVTQEAQRAAARRQEEQDQRERAAALKHDLARGALAGLSKEEALALWREAQK